METIYPINHYKFYDILKDSAIWIGLCFVICCIIYLFYPAKYSSIILIISIFAIMFAEADKDRLESLSFDEDNKALVVVFKSLVTGSKEKKIPFDLAKIEVREVKLKSRLAEPITLTIKKRLWTVFEIKTKKDQLTIETVKRIAAIAESLEITVVRN